MSSRSGRISVTRRQGVTDLLTPGGVSSRRAVTRSSFRCFFNIICNQREGEGDREGGEGGEGGRETGRRGRGRERGRKRERENDKNAPFSQEETPWQQATRAHFRERMSVIKRQQDTIVNMATEMSTCR